MVVGTGCGGPTPLPAPRLAQLSPAWAPQLGGGRVQLLHPTPDHALA